MSYPIKGLFRNTIITSAMDTDAYKLHMQQVVFEKYAAKEVVYEFNCRSDEDLSPYAAEIREEINALETVVFTEDQLTYLSKINFLKPAFIAFLRGFRFDPRRYIDVSVKNDQLSITCRGPWLYTILFEVPVLAIVSEVRNRNRFGEIGDDVFREVLFNKVEKLKKDIQERNITNFRFADFGTRRRFSYKVQEDVVGHLLKAVPEFMFGSSNYHFAREYGIVPIGTMAHEYLQAHQAFVNVVNSQKEALEVWNQVYRGRLGIALTDCITTDAFLRDFDYMFSVLFSGVRHDSGCPFIWGEKIIAHYEKMGIDPKTKSMVFSDSLNFDKALDIAEHFAGRIHVSFGIGTFLSNDMGDYVSPSGDAYKPLSIVMKMIECDGAPVAKISDEPAKSMCHDKEYLANLKKRFGVE